MSTIELKNKIIEQIEHCNDLVLMQISELLDKYEKEIVASDASGFPLTISEYNDRVEEGLTDLKYRRLTPHEDLLKDIEEGLLEIKSIQEGNLKPLSTQDLWDEK